MKPLLRLRRAAVPSVDDHQLRERRLEAVKETVDEFLYALAMGVAGHRPQFDDIASAELGKRLRRAFAEQHLHGGAIHPDFGAYADLRVEADLLHPQAGARAVVGFEDLSLFRSADGRFVAGPRRRVTLELVMSLEPCLVEECSFSFRT